MKTDSENLIKSCEIASRLRAIADEIDAMPFGDVWPEWSSLGGSNVTGLSYDIRFWREQPTVEQPRLDGPAREQ